MKKSELEAENNRLKQKNGLYRMALIAIRQNARECVDSGCKGSPKSISNVWAIELVTETITKADSV